MKFKLSVLLQSTEQFDIQIIFQHHT